MFLQRGTVIFLAGGLGTRLRSVVVDRPKVLANVGERPFLDMLIEKVQEFEPDRVVVSVGHMKEQIKTRYANQGILFAEEEVPLGTGGGVKNAERFVSGDFALVMNGDSWFRQPVNLPAFYKFHIAKQALVSMMLARPRTEKDYGTVSLATDSKIKTFNEKDQDAASEYFMSAGVYLMDKKAFALMPTGAFSLEKDFFPTLVGGLFYGFPTDAELIDIGTPERYEAAQKYFS